MAVARAVRSQVGVLCLLLVLALARQLSCSRCARRKNVQAADGSHHGEGNLRVFNSKYSRHEFSKDPFGPNEPVTGDVPKYGKKSVKPARLPLFEDSSTGSTIAYGQTAQDKPSAVDDDSDEAHLGAYVRIPFRDETYCGGVLITDRHVLTAGGCLRKGQKFKVSKMIWLSDGTLDGTLAANDTRIEKRKPVEICFASNYHEVQDVALNDWAVLKLHKPVNLTKHARSAYMPSGSNSDVNETSCYALGMRFRKPNETAPNDLSAMAVEATNCSWPSYNQNSKYPFKCFKPATGSGMRKPCIDDAGSPVFCLNTRYQQMTLNAIIGWSRIPTNDCVGGPAFAYEDGQFTVTKLTDFFGIMRSQCGI